MEIKPSRRAQSVKTSPTLKIAAHAAELQRNGRTVLNLAAVEPDFASPAHVRDAAIAAIAAGCDGYTEIDGTPALKDAVVEKFLRENKLRFTPDQILISNGCKHSLYNLMQALLDDDDEVIIPAPYWVSYPDMARLAGAEPVIVRTKAKQHFKMTPDLLRGALGPRTRLLVLNSPCNPTGAVYSAGELEALAHVLHDFPEVVIVCDDIYEHVRWTAEPFTNLLNVAPRLHERTVVINGVSKAYAMTGWRIGYAAGPAGLIGAMKRIQSQSTSHPAAVAQAAAVAALRGNQDAIAAHVATLRKRHDFLVAELRLIPGIELLPAAGTLYIFPDMSAIIDRLDAIDDDIALATWLLDEAGIATVPGTVFGAPGHLRLSYATPIESLREAAAGLRRLLG